MKHFYQLKEYDRLGKITADLEFENFEKAQRQALEIYRSGGDCTIFQWEESGEREEAFLTATFLFRKGFAPTVNYCEPTRPWKHSEQYLLKGATHMVDQSTREKK